MLAQLMRRNKFFGGNRDITFPGVCVFFFLQDYFLLYSVSFPRCEVSRFSDFEFGDCKLSKSTSDCCAIITAALSLDQDKKPALWILLVIDKMFDSDEYLEEMAGRQTTCELDISGSKMSSRADISIPPNSFGRNDHRTAMMKCTFDASTIDVSAFGDNNDIGSVSFELTGTITSNLKLLFSRRMRRARIVQHISMAKKLHQPISNFDPNLLLEHARFHRRCGVDLIAINTHMAAIPPSSELIHWVQSPGVFILPLADILNEDIVREWRYLAHQLISNGQGHNIQM